MSASPQTLVKPVMSVITPLARTGVNVWLDLRLILVYRTQWIQFVSVRSASAATAKATMSIDDDTITITTISITTTITA